MKYISINVSYVPKEISQKLKITHPKILFTYCQISEYLETSRWQTVIWLLNFPISWVYRVSLEHNLLTSITPKNSINREKRFSLLLLLLCFMFQSHDLALTWGFVSLLQYSMQKKRKRSKQANKISRNFNFIMSPVALDKASWLS